MISPAVAWSRSLWAMGLGAGLGCLFGALRPLARRAPGTADTVFVLVCFQLWLYHSFAVCCGDPRTVYLLMGFLGALGWEQTVGKILRPL